MHSLETLPPLREVIKQADLRAHKRFGQNFLTDLNLTRKIARLGGPLNDCIVIEIGPGPGGLTRALLLEGAQEVHAVEIDQRCLQVLDEIKQRDQRLHIHQEDALNWTFPGANPVRVVANLPYNIGTLLLTNWLEHIPIAQHVLSYTLMFQKEVAQRITAQVGQKSYGRLAVLTQLTCFAETLFDIPPEAFVPAPKVTSTVVRLTPLSERKTQHLHLVAQITKLAFGQRRKMLRRSLSSLHPNIEDILNETAINPAWRAEEIGADLYAKLAETIISHAQTS